MRKCTSIFSIGQDFFVKKGYTGKKNWSEGGLLREKDGCQTTEGDGRSFWLFRRREFSLFLYI